MLTGEALTLLDGLRSAPADEFDVGHFVRQCRAVTPVAALSDAMAQYGNKLQQQLIQLLNNDFEQYISLAVSIQGTDTLVEDILTPIYDVRKRLLGAFRSTHEKYSEIQDLFKQQHELRKKRMDLLSSVPMDVAEPPPGSKIGGIERRARYFTLRNNISSEFQQELQDSFLELFAAPSSSTEVSSILRAFSFCNLRGLASECCKNYIMTQLPTIGKPVDLPGFLNHERTKLYATQCHFFDESCSHRFSFLLNCLFDAVMETIALEGRGKQLFSTTNLQRFHQNYTSFMSFISFLQSLQPDFSTDDRVVVAINKWNPDVYFRLRSHGIIGRLENALMSPLSLVEKTPPPRLPSSSLHITYMVSDLLYSCFDDDIFIDQVSPSFFSFSIQILSRFATFLSQITNNLSESRVFLILADDIDLLVHWIQHGLKQHIRAHVLKDCPENFDASSLIDNSLALKAAELQTHRTALKRAAVNSVVEQCEVALDAVPRIKATYRTSGQKEPTSPLPYVQQLVAPFISAASKVSSSKERDSLGKNAIHAIASSYRLACIQLLDVIRQTELSLRRLKNTAGVNALADSFARVAQQLRLDVEQFRRLLNEAANGADWDVDSAADSIIAIIDASSTSSSSVNDKNATS